MTYTPSAEQFRGITMALRFVLWSQDQGERVAAGGDPADGPPCPATQADLPELASALASLVIVKERELVSLRRVTSDAEEEERVARESLEQALHTLEFKGAIAGAGLDDDDPQADG